MTNRGRPLLLRPSALALAVLFLLVALVPLAYTDEYGLGVIITAFIVVILNLSWNFQLGFAGVWNFGQLAIYAIGGYVAALVVMHLSLSPWLALLCGGAGSAILAVILAFPTLRLFGIYTSLLTFAFAEVIQFLIDNDNTGVTGGVFGLGPVNGLFESLSPVGSLRGYYWVCLAIVALTLWLVAVVVRSRLGLALLATRDSLRFAAARGVSPLRARVIAFAISGFIAGVAGALYTEFNGSISPTVMGLTPLSIFVTMLVIGGLGTFTGPLLGTAIVTAIQTALTDHPATAYTILGVILLVIVVFFPRGLVSSIGAAWQRMLAWIHEEEVAPAEPEGELVGEAAEAAPPPVRRGV